MIFDGFRRHIELEGRHATFSASKYAWLRYDDEKIIATFDKAMNAALGTRLHNVAAELIELGLKQQASKKTFNMYVNDAISYRMSPEVVLAYSVNIFGTVDAIYFGPAPKKPEFEGFKYILRIHDLKNGETPAKMDQLLIYAAIFLLEYKMKVSDIYIELRIYQNDDIEYYVPGIEEMVDIMSHIQHVDEIIERRREIMA